MTIYEIKDRLRSEDRYFFSPDTMKFFGQTISMFRVNKVEADIYFLRAKTKVQGIFTERYFDAIDNTLHTTLERLKDARTKLSLTDKNEQK